MKLDIDDPAIHKLLLPLVENLNGLEHAVKGNLVVRQSAPPYSLPEQSVRTFFHEHWPSHYSLNDIDYIACQMYRIALDRSNFEVEFLYGVTNSDTTWRLQQLLRWLLKSSLLSLGWTYLPMLSFVRRGSRTVFLTGDEGCGKAVAMDVLFELGYNFEPGGIIVEPNGQRALQLPVGTAASFAEWDSIKTKSASHGSNPIICSRADWYSLESCAVFFVDTWNERDDAIESLTDADVCRRLDKLNRREYEYFSRDQVQVLARRYQERLPLAAKVKSITMGLSSTHSVMREHFAI